MKLMDPIIATSPNLHRHKSAVDQEKVQIGADCMKSNKSAITKPNGDCVLEENLQSPQGSPQQKKSFKNKLPHIAIGETLLVAAASRSSSSLLNYKMA